MPATETRTLPASAQRLKAGPLQLLAQPKDGAQERRRFNLLARTVEPIADWWWGALVHDFAGMTVGDRIFVDYCHEADEVLGFGDKFTVEADGLRIEGELTPFTAEDRASEVQHKADAGVPYQCSIDYRGPCEYEWLPEGAYTEVNSRRVDGPAYIARKWTLRGVAICPLGWDGNTDAQLSPSSRDSSVTLYTEAQTMPAPAAAPAASAQTASAPAAAPAAAPATPATGATLSTPAAGDSAAAGSAATPATAATPAATLTPADATKQLQQFVADFGVENGGKWFSEGKTHTEAMQLHCAALTQQLAAAHTKAQELQTKLDGAQLGEQTPVTGGATNPAPSPESQRLTQNLGGNLAKYAGAIKLPSSK